MPWSLQWRITIPPCSSSDRIILFASLAEGIVEGIALRRSVSQFIDLDVVGAVDRQRVGAVIAPIDRDVAAVADRIAVYAIAGRPAGGIYLEIAVGVFPCDEPTAVLDRLGRRAGARPVVDEEAVGAGEISVTRSRLVSDLDVDDRAVGVGALDRERADGGCSR